MTACAQWPGRATILSEMSAATSESAWQRNVRDLERELDWFSALLDTRFHSYFRQATDVEDTAPVPPQPPDLGSSDAPYAQFLRDYQLEPAERIAVVLALSTHTRPHLLDAFATRNKHLDRPFTEFGGLRASAGQGSCPLARPWPSCSAALAWRPDSRLNYSRARTAHSSAAASSSCGGHRSATA